MAESTIDLRVNNNQAITALKQVESQVTKLNSVFETFRGLVASLALGSVITNSLKFADAISDISAASGLAVQNVVGFTRAVEENGGQLETAQNGLFKFTENLAKASEGSLEAQDAFLRAGLSLEELRTLSQQDILSKTLSNLGKLGDITEQNRIKTKLFGEEFKKVNIGGVSNDFQSLSAQSSAYVNAINNAAKVQGQLDKTLNDFRIAILNAISPLTEFVSKLNIGIETITNLIKILLVVGTTLLTLSLYGRVVAGLSAAFAGLGSAISTVQGFLLNLAARFSTTGTISKFFADALASIAVFLSNLITKLPGASSAIAYMGTLLQPLVGLFTGLGVATVAWWDSIKKFMGFKGPEVDWAKAPDQSDAETQRLNRQGTQVREITDALKKQKQAVQDITNGFIKQNLGLNEQLALQTRLVGKSEEEQEIINSQYELYKRYRDAREQLEQKIRDLTPEEKRLGLQEEITKEIQRLNIEHEKESTNLLDLVNRLQGAKLIEQDRLRTLELITKQYDDQKLRAESLQNVLKSARDSLQQEQFAASQMGKSPLEQQLASIQENARKAAMEAGRAYAQAFEDTGDGLTPERAQELSNGLDQIAKAYKNIADQQAQNLMASRTFNAGWQEAFNQYYDNATNAANQAREAFSSVTRAMESAIDKFVETGKFSFKDFARSVIADLLKIQLKAAAIQMFKSSGLGSLFAGFFADGGYIPPGKFGVVGEQGPELINGPANITPMGMGAQPVINNYITNNISAVDAKSVAQLFAENRKTLLGATEQARKELPIRQRF